MLTINITSFKSFNLPFSAFNNELKYKIRKRYILRLLY